MVASKVIFTIPHDPWNLRPIPISKTYLSKLIELLNEKFKMGILELSIVTYFNEWFIVP